MKIVIGLGNPGDKYVGTRHNLGFMVLDSLLKKFEPLKKTSWENQKKTNCFIKKLEIGKIKTILAKPTTFMNDSGNAVSSCLSWYKVKPQDLIVIHDDLDLPFGKIRVRFGGGSGGHNGVQSIIDTISTDKFLRIRLGIGRSVGSQKSLLRQGFEGQAKVRSHHSEKDYVLGEFEQGSQNKVRHMKKEAIKSTELILKHGYETYISKYNK